MTLLNRLQRWRNWFPVPNLRGQVQFERWVLLDGNRMAVALSLLTIVFGTIMAVGTLYTFEMQRLLTETGAVQTILNTLLSGIILLVSIVVSINSIVLSHDITSLENQEARIDGIMDFRREVANLSPNNVQPAAPDSFLEQMANVISQRTEAVKEAARRNQDGIDEDIEEFMRTVTEMVQRLEEPPSSGAEFSVIWLGLEVEYGSHLNTAQRLKNAYADDASEEFDERMDDLIEAFELFATGREYFKTLYYTEEVSELSRVLVAVSLPAILSTITTILAIDANLLPDLWLFGLPPLLTFVATTFTIALAPFVVLISYTLRVATVAKRTAASGSFSLD